MSEVTDAGLIQRFVAAGDSTAFEQLVRRPEPLVDSAALRVTADPGLAQDATQQVFLALNASARELTGRTSLSGWLYTTAQRTSAKLCSESGTRHFDFAA